MTMISVIDQLGTVVMNKMSQSSTADLNCSELAKGTYYIEAELKDGKIARGKVVIN